MRSGLKSLGAVADVDLVAGHPETSSTGMGLRARQVAVRQRAEKIPGIKIRQRSGRYWLDGVQGNVIAISAPMTLDELELELTRLTSEHLDGCQG